MAGGTGFYNAFQLYAIKLFEIYLSNNKIDYKTILLDDFYNALCYVKDINYNNGKRLLDEKCTFIIEQIYGDINGISNNMYNLYFNMYNDYCHIVKDTSNNIINNGNIIENNNDNITEENKISYICAPDCTYKKSDYRDIMTNTTIEIFKMRIVKIFKKLYKPFMSNFPENILSEEDIHSYKTSNILIKTIIMNIFNDEINNLVSRDTTDTIDIDKLCNMVNNIKKILFAVPYIASNTPSHNSEFSDYFFIISYTIISYKISHISINNTNNYIFNLNEKLDSNEFSKETYKDIINHMIKTANNNENTDKIVYPDRIYNIKTIGDYNKIQLLLKDTTIIKDYLNWIISHKLQISKLQYNCSAYDILSSSISCNRTGFTGTPFIPEIIDINDNIVPSKGDMGIIIGSIYGIHTPSTFIQINEKHSLIDQIIGVLSKYKSLIDIGSFLIEFTSRQVVEKISQNENMKKLFDYFVYIDNNGKKKYIKSDNVIDDYDYKDSSDKDTLFVYFDQKNITGIDIKQHYNAKALITIRKNLRFRDVAKGIFRMRQIATTQSIDFCIMNNIKDSTELLKIIINNEIIIGKSQEQLSYLQNSRTITRNLFYSHIDKFKGFVCDKFRKLNLASPTEYTCVKYVNNSIIYSIIHSPHLINFYDNIDDDKFKYITKTQYMLYKDHIYALCDFLKNYSIDCEIPLNILKKSTIEINIDNDVEREQEQEQSYDIDKIEYTDIYLYKYYESIAQYSVFKKMVNYIYIYQSFLFSDNMKKLLEHNKKYGNNNKYRNKKFIDISFS